MEFGIQIEPQFGYAYEDVAAIARDSERLGLTSLWLSDHLFLNAESARTNCLEAWTLLAALSQITLRLRLGVLVTCQSYRNPALLAKIAAGLDHMSGGRLEFGVGAGWKELEYRAYGYDFPSAGTRVEQLAETVEICKRMWSDEKATYEGRHYRIKDAQCSPKPLQARLRVWIGGRQPRLLRLTARHGDAINLGAWPSLDDYRAGMSALDAACAKVGRDPKAVLRSAFLPVLVAASQRELDEITGELAQRAGRPRDEWIAQRPTWVIGTPDRVIARLREFADAGMTYLIALFPYRLERAQLPVFASEVMPALRG